MWKCYVSFFIFFCCGTQQPSLLGRWQVLEIHSPAIGDYSYAPGAKEKYIVTVTSDSLIAETNFQRKESRKYWIKADTLFTEEKGDLLYTLQGDSLFLRSPKTNNEFISFRATWVRLRP